MDNFIVIPEWLAWCLLSGLAVNTLAQLVVLLNAWRERKKQWRWQPTIREL